MYHLYIINMCIISLAKHLLQKEFHCTVNTHVYYVFVEGTLILTYAKCAFQQLADREGFENLTFLMHVKSACLTLWCIDYNLNVHGTSYHFHFNIFIIMSSQYQFIVLVHVCIYQPDKGHNVFNALSLFLIDD